ncbi:GNAT family N-acetyltransferase [Mucilaginibacter kameinonensis]|uniref:GNAT family N-acetyltransferase n=1 Tax=Mucilaginibacter kameinonensis TaxID=452286 RepID=UPI000EF7CD37|nr:GNAT family N-acetyltransferase [Mucilaginibacter kameinonensis]
MTVIESDVYCIDPLGAADIRQYDQLVAGIYQLLTDEQTLRFLPEKKLQSMAAAENWLNAAILNFYSGRNQVHLIRSKGGGKLVGIIDLIPPAVAREHYRLADYPFFIEFYLKGDASGKNLMSRLLPQVLSHLAQEGVDQLAAVVNRRNIAAAKVLKRSGFCCAGQFDLQQDIYRYSALSNFRVLRPLRHSAGF